MAAHDYASTRYSPLAEVDTANVGTLREAWSFTIRNAAHSDGLILIFANTQRLDVKESWYRRVGARILVQRNVIVWLDRALAPAIVARCGVALARMA